MYVKTEELTARIKAYIRKLTLIGHNEHEATIMAMEEYRRVKHRFAPKQGDIVDHCNMCGYPLLHGEQYVVECGVEDKANVYHYECYESN